MRADRGDEDAWTTTLVRGFTRPASQVSTGVPPGPASSSGILSELRGHRPPVHNPEDRLGVVDGLVEEQDRHVDPRKANSYQDCWQDAPHCRTLLNGSCTSLPGTDGLGQPLFLASQDDPVSGLGGHAQVDRGDGVSRRV